MQKNFQKMKDREKNKYKKILKIREATRKTLAEKRKQELESMVFSAKQKPISNEELYKAQAMRELEIRLQLEHNKKILQALEEQYDADVAAGKIEPVTLPDNKIEIS